MPEAVIVATARTPIGRAFKGSLVNCRPDDLSTIAIEAALAQVPELDRNEVEDLLMGCGQPAGESGNNIARNVAILAGMPDVPGVTVNRYCSSSLQTIRMAAHAIKAGEGDVFIAAGVETVSRFHFGMADSGPHNTVFADAESRTEARANGGQGPWTPPAGLPDVYIAMGQTAENVAELEGVTREEMDEFAALSQQRASVVPRAAQDWWLHVYWARAQRWSPPPLLPLRVVPRPPLVLPPPPRPPLALPPPPPPPPLRVVPRVVPRVSGSTGAAAGTLFTCPLAAIPDGKNGVA